MRSADSGEWLESWPPAPRRAIQRRLLSWYEAHRRDLPWRRRAGDAYAQLVAEFMLQQTQVAAVSGHYERFLRRFPTVAALAAADRDDVLALWSGLGYYRRAGNLHAAARCIVAEHAGVVPASVDALMDLPGVGRYTAGAIASVAYDTRAPVLDGNAARVLMRLLAIRGDSQSGAVRSRLWSAAESLLPRTRCGDFNQALMELGATRCLPRSPGCARCPLRSHCRAYHDGLTNRIPAPGKRARVVPAVMAAAAVRRGSRILFVQRPATGLWAGLWELPTEPVPDGEDVSAARNRLRRRLPQRCRLGTIPVGQVTRQLTHRSITFHAYAGSVPSADRSRRPVNGQPSRWVQRADLGSLGISRACEALLVLIGWPA